MDVAGLGFIVLGYLLGQDGKPSQTLIIAPAGPDGQPLVGGGLSFLPARLSDGRSGGQGLDLEVLIERLHRDMQPYGTSTTYYLEKLLDARLADKVTLYLVSTCDQALTVQVVGHTTNDPTDSAGLVNIEASQTLAAGSTAASKLSLGVDLEVNWHPYLGVTVASGGTPPTTGHVVVQAAIRRWTRPFAGQQGV